MSQNDDSVSADEAAPSLVGMEVERKYLVQYLPDELSAMTGERILQGYLAVDGDGTEVRLRDKGGRCYLTVKSGSGMVRGEGETAITREQFETFWRFTAGRRLVKERFRVPLGQGVEADLDVYMEHHVGLVTAEVEFSSMDACHCFAPPPWFDREVTWEDAFKNRNLALHGVPIPIVSCAGEKAAEVRDRYTNHDLS